MFSLSGLTPQQTDLGTTEIKRAQLKLDRTTLLEMETYFDRKYQHILEQQRNNVPIQMPPAMVKVNPSDLRLRDLSIIL